MKSRLRTLGTLSSLLRGARVVLRLDLNMPMKDGRLTDSTRLERSASTLRLLLDKGASVVVLSHFGRPNGAVVPEMSLVPLASPLSEMVGHPVTFVKTGWRDAWGQDVGRMIQENRLILMENTRFHPGEEQNDPLLAKDMSSLGNLYVNDAFSAAHRAHASTEGIAHFLPSAAGCAMETEIDVLHAAFSHPKRPLFGLIGGAKISTKLGLLAHLVTEMDVLMLGGGLAHVFLAAQGTSIGASFCERDCVEEARRILDLAQSAGCEVILPVDACVKRTGRPHDITRIVAIDALDNNDAIMDIGPRSAALFGSRLETAGCVVWNGPLGCFEIAPFAEGTKAVARKIARLTPEKNLLSLAGGGDTLAAVRQAGVHEMLSYTSTGGGAFLAWLEGKTLPGVRVLLEDSSRAHTCKDAPFFTDIAVD